MAEDPPSHAAASLSPLQRAALTIKTLRARLDALAAEREPDPIAIVGMGCRFPGGADDPERYWALLRDGVDAVGRVPADRWDADAYYSPDPDARWKMVMREGGFIRQPIAEFDHELFGISPREAVGVDPQQRLLLEVAWEALEHAGIAPDSLVGSDTGVFVGFLSSDYGRIPLSAVAPVDLPYVGTGNALSFPAGRLSYVLGLQGPSMVLATACSSALTAVHVASQALRDGDASLALAAGVNLIIRPDNNIVMSKLRALAPDGRCKAFDKHADGYGRGEGCGVVVLERLSDARRRGHRVLALVRGSVVNHDGPSGGLTVPSGAAQEKLLRRSLEVAKLAAAEIDYVEAHGTGTPLGDPIELHALDAVYGAGRPDDRPLLVGSVKTNLAHLESAAGVASLIKVVLALGHEQLPPHLHLRERNPAVDWPRMRVEIPTTLRPWPRAERPRVAGMSGFGLSGINAHVLVQEAPEPPPRIAEDSPRAAEAFCLSAREGATLAKLAARWATALGEGSLRDAELRDLCHTANTGRAQLRERFAVVVDSPAQLRERLEEFAANPEPSSRWACGRAKPKPSVAYLFTGQGAQRIGMGAQLYRSEPSFRATLDRCAELLGARLEAPLLELLGITGPRDAAADERLARTANAQPALFALEYALAQLLGDWSLRPDYLLGHSLGEYVAACVAGVFSLADALALVAERGRLMQALPGAGAMAALALTPARARALIDELGGGLTLAAINSPSAVVVSGPEPAVLAALERAVADGVRARRLEVSHAFHSPLMEPMIAEFSAALARVPMRAPQLPILSNLDGRELGDAITRPDYWVRHLLRPVAFADGITRLLDAGVDLFVEVGPAPTLTAMGQACLTPEREQPSRRWLACMRPNKGEDEALFEALGGAWVAGVELDWRRVDAGRDRRPVAAPTYPFARRRSWLELQAGGDWDRPGLGEGGPRPGQGGHPLLGGRRRSPAREHEYTLELRPDAPAYVGDHRVYGEVLVPGAVWAELALAAAADHDGPTRVESLSFVRPLMLGAQQGAAVTVLVRPPGREAGGVEVYSSDGDDWITHASATLVAGREAAPAAIELETLRDGCERELDVGEYFATLAGAGLDYGERMRAIRQLWSGPQLAVARIELAAIVDARGYRLHPALLDACFQAAGVAGLADLQAREGEAAYLPVAVERLEVWEPGASAAWVRARVEPRPRGFVCDFELWSDDGRALAQIRGLSLREAPREALLTQREHWREWLYELAWEPLPPLESEPSEPSSCALLGGSTALAASLSAALSERGWSVSTIAELDQLLARWDGLAPAHVVDLRATSLVELDPDAVPSAALDATVASLELIQALVERQARTSLWLVTRGASKAVADDRVPASGLAAAPVWGFGRAVAREQPELGCRRVDLADHPSSEDGARLAAEIVGATEHDELALRGAARLAPRLRRSDRLRGAARVSIDPAAAYLITGGLGALGLLAAERLAALGARHLILLGRSVRDSARPTIAALEAEGVEVRVMQVDVGDPERVAAMFTELEASGPPLAGIIHAAGLIDDGVLVRQSRERFAAVFRPKVAGAWNLHRLAPASVRFLSLWGSAAALIGNAGQSNYVAANSFLDALAEHRRAAGLPALAIDWGGWAERGAAAGEQVRERMARLGVAAIPPELGLDVFVRSLALDGQLGVLPVDWAVLGERGSRPLYAELVRAATHEHASSKDGAPASARGRLRAELDALAPDDRRDALTLGVAKLVNGVLGRSDDDGLDLERGFFDLGMDSLMSVELRNLLQVELDCSLPSTLAFDHPNLAALVDYLADMLAEMPAVGSEPPTGASEPEPVEPSLGGGDDELASLLADLDELDDAQIHERLRRG